MQDGTITNAASPLDARQRARLTRIQRFLTGITDVRAGRKAAAAGYDDAEHQEGWALWQKAAGVDRTFAHFVALSAPAGALAEDEARRRFASLDAFENTWFPRVRTAIRRFVAADRVAQFEEAFFTGLAQQPEGPLVVGSVTKLLERLEGMRNSDVPGAADAYAALQKKGLTADALAQVKETLQQVRSLQAPPVPDIDPADIERGARTQLEAYGKLNLWFNDWATTLRPVLSYHESIRCGLLSRRGGRGSSDGAPTPDDELDVEPDFAPVDEDGEA